MSKRRKRSRYEIIHDILETVTQGARFTNIMYRANLSYDNTRRYVEKLLQKELIMQKDGLYYLTEKGLKLLDILKAYKQKKEELNQLM